MPRDLRQGEGLKRARARREFALARNETRPAHVAARSGSEPYVDGGQGPGRRGRGFDREVSERAGGFPVRCPHKSHPMISDWNDSWNRARKDCAARGLNPGGADRKPACDGNLRPNVHRYAQGHLWRQSLATVSRAIRTSPYQGVPVAGLRAAGKRAGKPSHPRGATTIDDVGRSETGRPIVLCKSSSGPHGAIPGPILVADVSAPLVSNWNFYLLEGDFQ